MEYFTVWLMIKRDILSFCLNQAVFSRLITGDYCMVDQHCLDIDSFVVDTIIVKILKVEYDLVKIYIFYDDKIYTNVK